MKKKQNIEQLAQSLTTEQKTNSFKAFYLSVGVLIIVGAPLLVLAYSVRCVFINRYSELYDVMTNAVRIAIAIFAVCYVSVIVSVKLKYPYYNDRLFVYLRRNAKAMHADELTEEQKKKCITLFLIKKTLSFLTILFFSYLIFKIYSIGSLTPPSDTLEIKALIGEYAGHLLSVLTCVEVWMILLIYVKVKYPLFVELSFLILD